MRTKIFYGFYIVVRNGDYATHFLRDNCHNDCLIKRIVSLFCVCFRHNKATFIKVNSALYKPCVLVN